MAGRFHTTKWSMVLEAGRRSGEGSLEALAGLCAAYWYPVYGFVRSQGYGEEDARDLTQSYFATLLDKNFLKDLRPDAGRFRSFLMVSIRNYLSNERDRTGAQKRGGGAITISLDTLEAEQRMRLEPAAPVSTEQSFERRWATTVVRRAMERLERDFVAAGQARRFHFLRGFLVGDAPTLPYAELARKLETSETAVKSMVLRLRKRFGVLLRAEVSQTVDRREDVEDEIRYLLRVLAER